MAITQTVKIYLVRHGHARAGFAEAQDPGLDNVGRTQAQAIAKELGPLGPLPLVTSPLKRARETAMAFEALWGLKARIEPAVAEIPSPTEDLQARAAWLRQAMRGGWNVLPAAYHNWRNGVATALIAFTTTTVVTTHFVAINAAVSVATDNDRMICFEPDYCSCTVLEVVDGKLHVAELGRQRETQVH